MKILYAANRNNNSRIQLSRFMEAMNNTDHQIKIAGYKDYLPKGLNIDWCLTALLNIYKPELLSLNNDNLHIYFDQIKSFAPDLIISDLEYFTSYLANLMNTPLWQCSSSIISHALPTSEKYDLGLFKFYAYSLNRDPQHTQRTANIIANSDCNFVYSHFGDAENSPKLQGNFEWIRPYHKVHRLHKPCQHYVVAGLSENNKQVVQVLKKYPDSVVFMDAGAEKYHNIKIKDINSEDEYYCNLRNCSYFVCQGQASFLADAFYNNKCPIIYPDYQDAESIINSHLSKKLLLGDINSNDADITDFQSTEVPPTYDDSIKYLHEKISEIA